MRAALLGYLLLLNPTLCLAQRYPFVPAGGAEEPRGLFTLFVDSKQRLWLAGMQTGTEGIFVFDGRQYLPVLKSQSPIGGVSGTSEDSQGGIWFAATNGVFRLAGGNLVRLTEGDAMGGIMKVAPDVFLVGIARGGTDSPFSVDRLSFVAGRWRPETLLHAAAMPRFSVDRSGNILFGCSGGYCEMRASDAARWSPGTEIDVAHHNFEANGIFQLDAVVIRDRFGCVWMRGLNGAASQCLGDPKPVAVPMVSMGRQIFELEDGSIAIPSNDSLAIGRPGKFHNILPANGFPASFSAGIGPDETIWLSSTQGLFRYPWRLGMEFWSAEEGLNGTVWSVVRREKKLFAMADRMRVLDQDRSRWLPSNGTTGRTYAGPNNTFLVMHDFGLVQTDLRGRVLAKSTSPRVWFTASGNDGSYWAGGDGIFRMVLQKRNLQLKPIGTPGQYDDVQGMQTAPNGDLWACGGFGVVRLNPSGKQLYQLGPLSARGCSTLTVNRVGDVWFGDLQPPLLGVIADSGTGTQAVKIFRSGGETGIAGAQLLGSDHRGWIWRGTSDGIYVADSEQARAGQWLHLTAADGLPALETNEGAFMEDEDGSVWIGAENSAIHISPPDDLVHPRYAPSVFVSSFSWNGGSLQIADQVESIRNGADLTAHVGSLQFDRRNALHFSYRVLPGQSSWSPAPGFDLHLGKLRWGSHTLQLRA